ncbi:FAD dependent oxidoreductase [Leeuwenhoekiella aestuarii]|uniref:FAD dependent oxidoreductase n=1 Tax=Leeuwenhoekiella aestuarii TaxID=2249426 RepID=A0A4Q0NYK7_9FLAO|nr:FAD dependent oxidoreductase [Leeuwenhoekiella aestuarii]RXG19306.1 FAD dependent oxidoreductase [Leeuwenhoekiella aestuarii]
MRVNGLKLLRETLGDKAIGYKNNGGYELFFKNKEASYNTCLEKLNTISTFLYPVFNIEVFSEVDNKFGFKNIQPKLIFNKAEAQLDTGKMMQSLMQKACSAAILILNNSTITGFEDVKNSVKILLDQMEFTTKKLFIATNGFASQLGIAQVKPARNQVLVTKLIENLKIKGTFHLDEGYTYFRNIDNRILLGGGRNLDLSGEQTAVFGTTSQIQNYLENMLSETILPTIPFEIEHRWSGILGVGNQKKPIIKELSNNVYCGVRLGGMGIAMGSLVGQELAKLLDSQG